MLMFRVPLGLLGRPRFFLSFMDDFSQKVWVFMLKKRDRTSDIQEVEDFDGEVDWQEAQASPQ